MVNSAVITINVTNPSLVLDSIGFVSSGQKFAISGVGQPGYAYILVGTANLVPPIVWVPVMTNMADRSAGISFTNLPITNWQKFYRISEK
jgi:hypothetical protein